MSDGVECVPRQRIQVQVLPEVSKTDEAQKTRENTAMDKVVGKPMYIKREVKEEESEESEEDEAHRLLKEHLQREKERKKKKSFSADAFNPLSVDDTDGLDPETEYLEWVERELNRVKRDKANREKIVEETKPVPEKKKEHLRFMQKYYHRGAFYQDEAIEDALLKDFDPAQPTINEVKDKEVLPQVLQTRDALGKRSRSKWTHLSAEDTTSFDYGWGDKKNASLLQNTKKNKRE